MSDSNTILEINTHGKSFLEMKTEVLDEIYEGYLNGYRIIRIIHGYKHGTNIKNYFRTEFIADFHMYCISNVTITIEKDETNPGCTKILFKE